MPFLTHEHYNYALNCVYYNTRLFEFAQLTFEFKFEYIYNNNIILILLCGNRSIVINSMFQTNYSQLEQSIIFYQAY